MQQIGYLTGRSRGPITRAGRRLFRTGEGLVEMDTSQDGGFERADDWSRTAYFYLNRPENALPKLPPVSRGRRGDRPCKRSGQHDVDEISVTAGAGLFN